MSIVRSATVVSVTTLLSRVLGMVRDIACASLLGAGAAWDAFVVAWRIPNLFRRLLGEGALSSAFIPVFSGERERGGPAAAFAFFQSVLTLLTVALALLAVLGLGAVLLLPGTLFGGGPAADKAELTLTLLEILFPYVILVNVMALFMAVLNSLDHFFAPALAPAVLNVFWIGGTVVARHAAPDEETRVRIVALSILVGGVVQLAMQIPFLRSRGVPLRPRFEPRNPGVRRMLVLMFPMVLGLAPVQVNLLLDTLIAEAFVPGDGANSYLFFGNRLMQFPLALIGIAMAVVVFPLFSRQAKEGRHEELSRSLSEALRITFFLALPAAAGLLALASPLIALIYEHGRFGTADTAATANVLAMYALGVPAYCGLQILTRLYYSLEDVRTPMRVGAAMVLVNLLLNLALVGPMEEAGLALATAISALLNLAALGWIAHRRLGIAGLPRVGLSFVRSLVLAGVMGAAVFALSAALRDALPARTLGHKALWALPPALLGLVVHFGLARALRLPEAKRLLRR